MSQITTHRKSLFDISLRDIQLDKHMIVIREIEPAYNDSFAYYLCTIREIHNPESKDPVVCVWIKAMSFDDKRWYKSSSTLAWFRASKILRIDNNLQYELLPEP